MTITDIGAALTARGLDVEAMTEAGETYLSVLRADGAEVYIHERPTGYLVQHWEFGETFAEAIVPAGDDPVATLADRVAISDAQAEAEARAEAAQEGGAR